VETLAHAWRRYVDEQLSGLLAALFPAWQPHHSHAALGVRLFQNHVARQDAQVPCCCCRRVEYQTRYAVPLTIALCRGDRRRCMQAADYCPQTFQQLIRAAMLAAAVHHSAAAEGLGPGSFQLPDAQHVPAQPAGVKEALHRCAARAACRVPCMPWMLLACLGSGGNDLDSLPR
jgi:hypothetical protein